MSALLGSGGIPGVAGFVRNYMQAGIDERVNLTADRAPSFAGSACSLGRRQLECQPQISS
jgi:hypothetical protein